VVDAGKGKEVFGVRETPRPFEVGELYDAVSAAVGELRITGLTDSDEVYVDGRVVSQLAELLPDPYGRPSTSCPPETIRMLLGGFSESVRHYRCFRITAWEGELVLSLFVRFTGVHGRLFAEGVSYLLAPLPARYHLLDERPGTPTPLEVVRIVRDSIPAGIVSPLAGPLRLLRDGYRCVRRSLRRLEDRLTIANGYVFDYGARASVRARSAGRDYRRYFQKLDEQMYGKYLERQVLDGVVTFLDAHAIDTSDLVERQTTILNQGVLMSGGSLVAEQLAVGRGAKIRAALRRQPPRAQPVRTK
jgi:hypothetical protein